MQLFQYLSYGFHILFAFAFGVDEDVIEIYYYKNIKLFCQDLVDIILEDSQCIGQSKRHHLVFEMVIVGSESRFSFIAFLDPYLMVGISQIKLGEMSISVKAGQLVNY